MYPIYQAMMYSHISVGVIALILFWLPIASKKGSKLHKQSGAWYSRFMWALIFTGGVMTILTLISPLAVLNPEGAMPKNPESYVNNRRMLFLFFAMLISLIASNLMMGERTLKGRQDRTNLRGTSMQLTIHVLLLSGLATLVVGYLLGQVLFGIYGMIGVIGYYGAQRYIWKKETASNEWLIQHVGAMVGSGIGVYTAFFVFGGRSMYQGLLTGHWQLLPWIAPAVIGTIGIEWYCRRNFPKKSKKQHTAAITQ